MYCGNCLTVFLLATLITLVSCDFNHGDLIRTFIVKHKQIKPVNLLLCKKTQLFETAKFLMAEGLQVKYLRVQDVTISDFANIFACELFRKIIVLDLDCKESEGLLVNLKNESKVFSACNHWLMIAQTQPITLDIFEQLPISVNAEITLATSQFKINESENTSKTISSGGIYWLYDLWSPGIPLGGSLNVTFIGIYNPQVDIENFQLRTHDTTLIRRQNLNLFTLRGVIVVTNKIKEPFENYLKHKYDTHLDSMHRSSYILHSYVRDLFNFTLKMFRSNSWGYPNPKHNNTFDYGMIGYLVQGEAEIGVSPAFFKEERARVIDYTVRTWIARPCFIFRHPDTTGLVRNVFLIPFTGSVWISIFGFGMIWILITGRIISMERRINTDGVNGEARRRPHENTLRSDESVYIASNFVFRNIIKSLAKCLPGNKSKLCRRTREDMKRKPNSYDKFKKDGAYGVKEREKESGGLTQRGGDLLFRDTLHNRLQGFRRTTPSLRFYQRTGVKEVVSLQGGKPAMIVNSKNGNSADVNDEKHNVINIQGTNRGIIENNDKKKSSNSVHPVAPSIGQTQSSAAERYSRSLLLFVRAMSQQGTDENESPTNITGRLVMQILVLFAFSVYQFYSASVVGSLLMEKPKTIKTLRNLLDSSLELGIDEIPYNIDFFRRTTDPDAKELYTTRIVYTDKSNQRHERFLRSIDGVMKVKKGNFAFHVDDDSTAYTIITNEFTEKEICDLVEIEVYPPQHMTSMVAKGSPYRKMMIYGLRKVTEMGLLHRERQFWHAAKPKCTRQIQSADLIVGIDSVFSAHMLLWSGIVLGIMLLCMECIIKMLKRRFNRS